MHSHYLMPDQTWTFGSVQLSDGSTLEVDDEMTAKLNSLLYWGGVALQRRSKSPPRSQASRQALPESPGLARESLIFIAPTELATQKPHANLAASRQV